LVRHGHLPEREVQTGIGAVAVKVPRVRDRAPDGDGLKFTSTILPPYLRRAKSIEELLPWLYLKGISSGDFSEALAALLGPDAPGLSASTITRLKADWWEEYERWSRRDLSAKAYVYLWADGVYFTPRMDEDRHGMLVIIGADDWGNKDVLGLIDGFRESTQSWRELLVDLKSRGLQAAPKLAVGDGAIVCPAAVLNTAAVVGRGVIVNTAAVVEHHVHLGDCAHVAPNATLCGSVTVGALALVGAGAVVLPDVTVGKGAIVAAGSAAARDVAPGAISGLPKKGGS
jgi:transposase-like protein